MPEDRTDNQDAPRGMSRRDFLKALSVTAAAGVAAAAGVRLSQRQTNPEGDATTPLETPTSTPQETAPPQEVLQFDERGVKVWFQDGMPTRWEDQNNQGQFDHEKLLEAKRLADAEEEIVVAQVVRVEPEQVIAPSTTVATEVSTTEGIRALPEDIVSTEELAQRGIEIIDSPNTGFHIRRSAFEGEGLMAQYMVGGERKLKIAITDKLTILQETFADARYDPIKEVVGKALPTVADAHMTVRANWQSGNDLQNQLYEQALDLVTPQEIVDWGVMGIAGYTIPRGTEQGSEDTDYLFLAVGEKRDRPEAFDVIQVQYASPGWSSRGFKISIQEVPVEEAFEPRNILELQPDQSYTNPEEYPRIESHGEGSFEWKVLAGVEPDSKDAYYVAMHELDHLKRAAELDALSQRPEGVELLRYFSEQVVDWATWERLNEAYVHKEETGSDSKYPIVLEDKKDGYFVIG